MLSSNNLEKFKVKKFCPCGTCALPALEYSDGEIIVFNEHKGRKHINHIPIDRLIELALEDGYFSQITTKLKEYKEEILNYGK